MKTWDTRRTDSGHIQTHTHNHNERKSRREIIIEKVFSEPKKD